MTTVSFQDPSTIQAILGYAHTIAVVGLSSKPDRPGYQVADYLRQRGYRIFAVNPNEREVFGNPAYARLAD
ncbi:MAG: CoA-binding protein, partial [Chloroflexota bacterium]